MSTEFIIEEEMSQFNASITITELLMKTLENCAKDLASRCITEVANRHGFDASEEIKLLGLENLALIRKQMAKKSASLKEKGQKIPKEKKIVIPMPFVPSAVNRDGCQGLAYNRGLFTQCAKKPLEKGQFCKGCQAEASTNANGIPNCGSVDCRLQTGLYEFTDAKGRSPVSYLKVIEKLKLSIDAVMEEAGKLHIRIPEEHFSAVEKPKKSASGTRGRPKKTGQVKADNVTDLFAKLSAEGDEVIEEVETGEDKPVKPKKAKLSDEEKQAKKQQLEAERAIKKAEREQKMAIEKAEREEKRKAEAAQKKAEREEKLALEKQEREEKRALEKMERDNKKAAEKLAKEQAKAAEKLAKEQAKKSKSNKSTPVTSDNEEPVAKPVAKSVEKPVEKPVEKSKVRVERKTIGGITYLVSGTGVVYDVTTKDELGMYNAETNSITYFQYDEEEEVDAEEYEE